MKLPGFTESWQKRIINLKPIEFNLCLPLLQRTFNPMQIVQQAMISLYGIINLDKMCRDNYILKYILFIYLWRIEYNNQLFVIR